tara:strand:+ start:272 stop:649 length:378 start_codon:yes stop_codon:yes gene_type:complete
MSNLDEIIHELRSVVEFENSHLKKGQFRPLEETANLKQNCLTQLNTAFSNGAPVEQASKTAQSLKKVQSLLKENEYLMKSAINSVKSAYNQINAIRNREAKVGAYDRFGKTVNLPDSEGLKIKLV